MDTPSASTASLPGRATELERLTVVVGEQLRAVGQPLGGHALDPLGRRDVLVHTGEPRIWP